MPVSRLIGYFIQVYGAVVTRFQKEHVGAMHPFRCLAFAMALPLCAHATKPEHIVIDSYDGFASGKCRSASLTDDGVLAAGPAIAKLADLGAEEAWAMLPQSDGSILVGTAPEGKLLCVGTDGAVKQLAKFDESHLYAMALGPHGEIYVGTSPDGKIYQVNAAGKAEVYFEPKEKYIWALAVAPDGTLYAGTGTKGKIYRVTGKGQGEVWYASNETHIRALAFDKKGALLAGSSDSGYLYRVTGKDQAVVLAETDREEVNQIKVTPDGAIYFTATGTPKTPAANSASSDKKSPDADSSMGPLRELLMVDGQHSGDSSSPATPHDSSDTSRLYRLDASLYPQLLWETKEIILSMAWNDHDSVALVGTGNQGHIYSVTPHGEGMRLGKIESDSITAILTTAHDTLVAGSNPGRLFRLEHEMSQPGIYESDIIDSGGFARWGAVTLGATESGSVKIMTRSGNTTKPDKTWYPWLDAKNGQPQSSPARYLQVQLQIGGGTVDKMDVCYLPKNLPPHIETIRILPVGTGYVPYQSPASSPSPRSAEQLLITPEKNDADSKSVTRWQVNSAHGLRTVTWKAHDPNDDELTYTVSWRKQGETAWHELAKDYKETVLSWDTSGWIDGKYELKVTASDADDNVPGEGLQDESISRELVIDNTPPVIHILSRKSDSVEFTVTDELSGLQSVTVSTNGKDYKSLPPTDGILDSSPKRFIAKIAPGQPLFIRAEDGSGNVAGTQAKE